MTVTILCPITSRGIPSRCAADQPLFRALLPSMDALELWGAVRLVCGYDSDDPVWSMRMARERATQPIMWMGIEGLSGNITAIWNLMATLQLTVPFYDYVIPANDDLVFETSPLPAIDKLRARQNFGIVAFHDYSFPGLPTFFMVGRPHFEIFGALYPLPWTGAHQDSWIHDVYKPWEASEIDPSIRCANHMGTGPRFDYGGTAGYHEAVMIGRRTVNNWLESHPEIAPPLTTFSLESAPLVIRHE